MSLDLYLAFTAWAEGYTSSYWLTLNQATEKGGGEEGTEGIDGCVLETA